MPREDPRLAYLPPKPGSYALIFRCNFARNVKIGALGQLKTDPGWYVYCGSAFGPGGLRARVGRHLRARKPKRWHIDYLRPFLRLTGVWYSTAPRNLEHAWADRLMDIAYRTSAATVPLEKFGASDCGCLSHLVRLPFKPGPEHLRPRGRRGHGVFALSWDTSDAEERPPGAKVPRLRRKRTAR